MVWNSSPYCHSDVWISYLDIVATATSEGFTSVYNSSRNLVVIVRDGGGTPIKEFICNNL